MLLPAQSLPRSPASASADSAESFANALLKSTTKLHRRLDEVDFLNMRDFLQVPVSTSIFYSPRTAPSFSNAPLPLAFPSAQISAKTRKQDLALLASPLPLSTCPPHRQPASLVLPSTNRLAAHLPKPLAFACAQQRTVMLCVEPEHQGQASEGFSVQAVDVTVGGAGCACAPSSGGCPKSPLELFPLHLSAHERSNFLFAVDLVGLPISEEEALHVVPKPPLSHGNDAGSRAKGGTEEHFFDETVSSALELRVRPCPAAVTGSGPNKQPSAAGTPFAIPYYFYAAYLINRPRADFSHPTSSYLLSPFVNMSGTFWSRRCSLFVDLVAQLALELAAPFDVLIGVITTLTHGSAIKNSTITLAFSFLIPVRGRSDKNLKWANPVDRVPQSRAAVFAASLADSNHTILSQKKQDV
ncbi:hypothetical protein EDB86DRAFT_3075274 [Lactarius hatsudake]|nr:hypothetical protein EDB86DRAFT_3075274 [Lactarius hatsudake]